MAIKGAYVWRGISLPEAYVRIANVQGNPRDGFTIEFCIYSSQAFAASDENKYKMMQGSQLHVAAPDPTQVFAIGYAALKARPELANFVDC